MGVDVGKAATSLSLILFNAFFVAAEYSLVGARRNSIELLAQKGDRRAKLLLAALDNMAPYVAGVQVCITMLGIGIGLVAEPFISDLIKAGLDLFLDAKTLLQLKTAVSIFSVAVITYFTVVFGELVPKFVSLRNADGIALVTIAPLHLVVKAFAPLVWLVQNSGRLVLKPFGFDVNAEGEHVSRDELRMMIRAGGTSGAIDKGHAELVNRALKLDSLMAREIMIHRIDVRWLDAALSGDALKDRIYALSYHRFPVCRGDIDDLVGIAYIHDIIRHWDQPDFDLTRVTREAVVVPENLTLDRIVEVMRERRTQMVIVVDEYGGTSGLITLEDVIEEVFGELEDSLESERPPVRVLASGRVSARAELRMDELLQRLGIDKPDAPTDTLATILVEALERVPRQGDSISTEFGIMRVENMARRRITRVTLQLASDLAEQIQRADG